MVWLSLAHSIAFGIEKVYHIHIQYNIIQYIASTCLSMCCAAKPTMTTCAFGTAGSVTGRGGATGHQTILQLCDWLRGWAAAHHSDGSFLAGGQQQKLSFMYRCVVAAHFEGFSLPPLRCRCCCCILFCFVFFFSFLFFSLAFLGFGWDGY